MDNRLIFLYGLIFARAILEGNLDQLFEGFGWMKEDLYGPKVALAQG